MKKWLIGLCCVLAVTAIAFVTVVNNQNGRIDTLNKDLGEIQTEVNTLKEKNAESEKTIQGLNEQVDSLTTERDQLTAENGKLAEDLENLNRNLSSSEQKLQNVMYILTDGAQGSIDSMMDILTKNAEEAAAEEVPAEEKLAEEVPAEEKPAEEAVTEAPAEEKPAEEAPAEEKPAEEAPAEAPAAEAAPAEAPAAEEAAGA